MRILLVQSVPHIQITHVHNSFSNYKPHCRTRLEIKLRLTDADLTLNWHRQVSIQRKSYMYAIHISCTHLFLNISFCKPESSLESGVKQGAKIPKLLPNCSAHLVVRLCAPEAGLSAERPNQSSAIIDGAAEGSSLYDQI